MELATGKFSVYGSNSFVERPQHEAQYRARMLFDLQLLGKPDESRTHAGASIEEAVRTAKIIVQSTLVPGTYGFRLIRNGLEVFLWFNEQDG
jgi:hypothetical protein